MNRYGSLFSGAGLLDYGLHQAIPALDCRFAIECDDKRRAIFGAHFPGARLECDVDEVAGRAVDLPAIDGLVGGVPCNTHSTANVAGVRGLAREWDSTRAIIKATQPVWTLWESSGRAQIWRTWVPSVRRDLWRMGHASVCVRVRTAGSVAPHERVRACVVSWSRTADADQGGQSTRAVHAEASRLREAPAEVWDGGGGPRSSVRMDDGVDRTLAVAIGYGVDQRTTEAAARILGALIESLS